MSAQPLLAHQARHTLAATDAHAPELLVDSRRSVPPAASAIQMRDLDTELLVIAASLAAGMRLPRVEPAASDLVAPAQKCHSVLHPMHGVRQHHPSQFHGIAIAIPA